MLNIDFSPDMQRIVYWGQRMGVDLNHSRSITEPYMWCQNHLKALADLLVDYNGFRHVHLTDNRMLFAVAPDPYVTNSSLYRRGSSRMVDEQNNCIELPINASSFFSPGRRARWEEIFHNQVWNIYDRPAIPGVCNPIMDLLNLLQCLLPGMFLLVEVHNGWSRQRGIPHCNWIRENRDILISSIGIGRYNALSTAAANPENSIIDSRNIY